MDVTAQRRTRRTAVRMGRSVLLAALLALAFTAACASGPQHSGAGAGQSASRSTAATQRTKTVVRTYTPFDASGRLTVPVAQTLSGHCWETSLAAPAKSSYRCLAGNRILDPCFVAPSHTRMAACVADPWSKAVVLHLTEPLPGGHVPADSLRPWILVLAGKGGSVRCVAITGTAPFVNGVGLPYACANGSYAAVRNAGSAQVRAVVGRVHGHVLQPAAVTMIWHG